jgi:serine/threonine protein kinase
MTQTRSTSSSGGGGEGSVVDEEGMNPAASSVAAAANDDDILLLPPTNNNNRDDNDAGAGAVGTSLSSSSSLLPRKRQATKSPAPPDTSCEDHHHHNNNNMMGSSTADHPSSSLTSKDDKEQTAEEAEVVATTSSSGDGGANDNNNKNNTAKEEEGTLLRTSTPINEMNSSDINQILHMNNSIMDDENDVDDNNDDDAVRDCLGSGSDGGGGGGRTNNMSSVSLNASFEAAAAAAATVTTTAASATATTTATTSINHRHLHASPKKRSKTKESETIILEKGSNTSSSCGNNLKQQSLSSQQQQVPDTPLRPPTSSKVSKRQKGGGGILFSPKPVYSKGSKTSSSGGGERMERMKGGGSSTIGGNTASRKKRPPRSTAPSFGEGGGAAAAAAQHSSPIVNDIVEKRTQSSPATPFRFHAFPDSLPRVHPRGSSITQGKEGGILYDPSASVAGGSGSGNGVVGTDSSSNNPTPFRLDESFGSSSDQVPLREGGGGELPTQRVNLRPKKSAPEENVSMIMPHSSPATRQLFRPNPAASGEEAPMIQLASTQSFDVAESRDAISGALLVARNDSNDQNDISGEWSEPTEMSMTNKLIRMSNVPTSISALRHHKEGDEDDETDTIMEEDIIENEESKKKEDAAAGLAGTKLNFNSPTGATVLNQKSETPDHYQMHKLDVSPIHHDDGSPMKGMEVTENDDGGNMSHSYLPLSTNAAATTTYNADISTLYTVNASEATASTVNVNNTTLNSYASNLTRPNPRRTSRPMPDTSAFDVCTPSQSSFRSQDSGVHSHKTSELLCPPTPIRTPAWAHNVETARGGGGGQGGQHLLRANSLITTKVLAECPPRVFDNLSSLEDSMLEHDVSCSTESIQHPALSASFLPVEETDENDSSEGDEGGSTTRGAIGDTSMEKMPSLKSAPVTSAKKQSRVSIDVGPVTFSDFDNVGVLGSGAFADVFKVKSKKDDAFYAIKRTRRQFRGVKDRERAMAEVNTMKRLQSAALVESAAVASNQKSQQGDVAGEAHSKTNYGLYLLFFIRAWQQDGFFYCQTELCSRATCRHLRLSLSTDWEKDVIKYPSLVLCLDSDAGTKKFRLQDRLIPEKAIWQMCHDISRGLFHIHSHGMVHYDIKPSNIFFVANSKWGTICKIGDFGLAGDIGASDDGQEGDTSYMANELLSSSLKHPGADIFSLGLTLYELAASATWALPREGDRWHDLRSASHTPELPSTRNETLVKLIQVMIHPDPKQRPSAEEITEHVDVKRASASSDSFLSQYIGDVERNDSRREKEIESAEEDARKR